MAKDRSKLRQEDHTDPTPNLEELRRYAIERSADDAVIIPAGNVIIDPRVRFKCMIPRCHMSGMCSHCPPYGCSTAEMRDILQRYRFGIFFRVGVKSEVIANPCISRSIIEGVLDDKGATLNIGPYYFLVFSIVKLLERKARAMGYKSPMGFAAGDCRDILCSIQFACQKTLTNRSCRVPELSAPSMESCGMSVYTMAARAGWDIYPIGGTAQPEDVPQGSLLGLVLII